ncbi:MAG: thioredoxin family protein [Rhodobacteraceae bacterium]|nr:thioredoxin family protein [Paracoccaceae bacterium]
MDRRHFIALGIASLAATPLHASYRATIYTPGMIGDLSQTRQTAILNFNATWSLTCKIKREIIADIKAANPDYARYITFVDIDWDTYGPSQMAQRLRVERRSTLIARRGEDELGRIVAELDPARIQLFLQDTLDAARRG